MASGPDPKAQRNLSDPDSRILRKSKNQAFAQAYTAQLAVDADGSQLILGAYISQSSADKNELQPMLEAAIDNLGQKPQAVLADRGYINGPIIEPQDALKLIMSHAHEIYIPRKISTPRAYATAIFRKRNSTIRHAVW